MTHGRWLLFKQLQNFILRLRNSISHPLDTNPQTQFPNSGFSTNRGKTGEIENFVFINSPDVTKNIRSCEYPLINKPQPS